MGNAKEQYRHINCCMSEHVYIRLNNFENKENMQEEKRREKRIEGRRERKGEEKGREGKGEETRREYKLTPSKKNVTNMWLKTIKDTGL